MRPGSIFRINFWPAWPAAHGHPVIVWEQYEDGMLLLLPCSHQEKYLAKGLCLTDSNCPSAFKVGSPFAIDGKRSFLHFRELEYITSDMPRVKTCDSGLGAFIDQALQTVHFQSGGKPLVTH
jgi:hypothetical protein